ncbi:hypothetical protein BH23BAC4_BH23BAC4_17510 [soil metagenome]
MPTYVYRRPDGTTFEVTQRISEDALTVDPETGVPVRRVIGGGAGLIFKGSGFYLTDYVHKGKDQAEKAEKGEKSDKPDAAAKGDKADKSEKAAPAEKKDKPAEKSSSAEAKKPEKSSSPPKSE